MSKHTDDPALEGIGLSDVLPLAWERLAAPPCQAEWLREQRHNEELLQHLLLRDEAAVEGAAGESEQEHFQRLESRLDWLVSLVSEMLMASAGPLPPATPVRLTAKGLQVQQGEARQLAPTQDTLLRMHLYLEPQFPRPLRLGAKVVAVQGQDFTVVFLPLEARLQALLDKYLFRQHRRAIALARQGENT